MTAREPSRGRGLALAAGGARGAYQAGAMLGLAENGVRFQAVAGSSIGSLNGAFYVQSDGSAAAMHELCNLWRSLPSLELLRLDPAAAAGTAAKLARMGTIDGALSTLLSKSTMSILDPGPIAGVLDRWIDYAAVCDSPNTLVVTVLPAFNPIVDIVTATWRQADYLTAAELGPDQLRQALLATSAIPLVFPAQKVQGTHSGDAALTDPLPAGELRRRGMDPIVSIFLSDDVVQNRTDYPGTTLHSIRPDLSASGGLRSVFDFSDATINNLINIGYRDAIAGLAEIKRIAEPVVDLKRQGDINIALAEGLPIPHPRDLPAEP